MYWNSLGIDIFFCFIFCNHYSSTTNSQKNEVHHCCCNFCWFNYLYQAAPAVPVSEEIQTIQHDIKNLNSDFNNLIQSLNLNLNEATQEDLAKGYESDELIAELGRSLLKLPEIRMVMFFPSCTKLLKETLLTMTLLALLMFQKEVGSSPSTITKFPLMPLLKLLNTLSFLIIHFQTQITLIMY